MEVNSTEKTFLQHLLCDLGEIIEDDHHYVLLFIILWFRSHSLANDCIKNAVTGGTILWHILYVQQETKLFAICSCLTCCFVTAAVLFGARWAKNLYVLIQLTIEKQEDGRYSGMLAVCVYQFALRVVTIIKLLQPSILHNTLRWMPRSEKNKYTIYTICKNIRDNLKKNLQDIGNEILRNTTLKPLEV